MQRPTLHGSVALLGRTGRVAGALVTESIRHRVPGFAAETAFLVVLGIFPGLLIATGLLGVLDVLVGADVAVGAQDRVVGSLRVLLGEEADATVRSVDGLFEEGQGQLVTFAALGGLVTLSGAFAVVIDALNMAYDAPEQRSWLRQRLLGLVLAGSSLVVVVLALAVLVVGPLFGQGAELAEIAGLGPTFTFVWDVLRLPVMVLGVVLWAAAVFRLAPNRATRWRDSLPGAGLTAALWLLGSGGFHLYLLVIAGRNPVLGAFGGGVIVMVWVYLLCLALLLGGELNAVLLSRRSKRG